MSDASQLFEEFAVATYEHLKTTDDLSTLVSQHEAFAEATKIADEKRLKSRAAGQALEQHRQEHGCREDSTADKMNGDFNVG